MSSPIVSTTFTIKINVLYVKQSIQEYFFLYQAIVSLLKRDLKKKLLEKKNCVIRYHNTLLKTECTFSRTTSSLHFLTLKCMNSLFRRFSGHNLR